MVGCIVVLLCGVDVSRFDLCLILVITSVCWWIGCGVLGFVGLGWVCLCLCWCVAWVVLVDLFVGV